MSNTECSLKHNRISQLLNQYLALAASPRNKNLLQEIWRRPDLAYLDDIGVPRAGAVPIIADPQLSMWARKMDGSTA